MLVAATARITPSTCTGTSPSARPGAATCGSCMPSSTNTVPFIKNEMTDHSEPDTSDLRASNVE